MSKDRSIRCNQCEVLNEPGTTFCVRCGASLRDFGGRSRFRQRHRTTLGGALLAFVMFVVLIVVVTVLGVVVYRTTHPLPTVDRVAGVSGTPASTSTTLGAGSTATTAADSSTSSTLGSVLERPKASTASSSLKPTTSQDFRAPNLVDSNPATAWIEGADGTGTGEWVKFEFVSPLTLSRIDVTNGYQLDDSHFNGDARIKTIEVEYSDGESQVVDLLDTRDVQSITALPVRTEWVKITIYSAHPDYIWADAALSEVRFYELAE
jgi:hypothetical protein